MIKSFIAILCLLFVCNSFANEPSGYTVGDIAPGSTFEKLGIQTGDIIVSFDGKTVDSPKDSMELYNEMKKGTIATVVVKRDGKKKTLNLK